MKILHINTEQIGGAALCAIRISKALGNIGVESRMLFANGKSMPDGIEGAIAEPDNVFWYSNTLLTKVKHLINRMPWYWDKEKADILLQRELAKIKDMLYTHHPYSYYKNIAHHPLVDWADIIHLHWIPDFVDYPSFFKEVKKPIVWTLHDMHPSRGVMHFYSDFSKLPGELFAIENLFCEVKRRSVKKARSLHTVAISEMMLIEILNSRILSGFPCSLIHNGVDTSIFKPIGTKHKANQFLFSSYDIWDKRKGLDRIINALEKIDIPEKSLMVLGYNSCKVTPKASFPIIEIGLISSQQELSKIYSQADFFINASYEEAFAQTPLEAMACGTPVISTPCSGANDLIRPFNGVICNGYDVDAIAEGIGKAVRAKFDSMAIRQYIVDNYEYSIIAEQYKALYEEILV